MHAFRTFTIGWRRKAAAYRIFGALPGGRRLYYLTQRHVTRTIPRDLAVHGRWAAEHAAAFARFYQGDLGAATLFEFGAGWDLHNSLVQWCYGVDRQVVVDIVRWARADQINHTIRFLGLNPPPRARRIPRITVGRRFEPALSRHYGIEYIAPGDARSTRFRAGEVDLVCTTSVLEHVPPEALADIMRESRRICGPRSVLSHVIDYSDHYAHSDPAIGIYNFLQFTEREWQRFNPPLHYQNRLRHFEYGELFRASGFSTLAETAVTPESASQLLAHAPLSGRFRDMEPGRLAPRTGHWVLRVA